MKTITGKYIATALLRCPQCGKAYTKNKECYNQKQASSWSTWMMRNYKGVCTECWKASQKGERL